MAFHRVEDGPWPRGTTVTAWPEGSVVGGVATGPPASSAVADADGVVSFGNLTEGAIYTALGHGGSQTFEAINQETRLRTLEGSSAARFNARNQFGATGNGSSDDTAAIQAAIDAAEAYVAGGSWMRAASVELPTGAYQLSAPLTVQVDNVQLVGHGPGNPKGAAVDTNPLYGGTVLRPSASFAGAQVLQVGRAIADRALSGVYLRDFSIDAAAVTTLSGNYVTGGTVGGVLFQAFNGGIDRVYVARVGGHAFDMQAIANDTTFPRGAFDNRLTGLKADSVGGAGFHTTVGATDNIFLGCVFEYCTSHGMYLEGSGQQVNGCDIYNCLGQAINGTARAQNIVGSRFIDCNGGVYLGSNEGADFTIVSNSFRSLSYDADNTYDGVNITPSGIIRGGVIVGNAFSTLQRNGPANRMRYGVNIQAQMNGAVVAWNSAGYLPPATSTFATGFLNDLGSNTTVAGLGQLNAQTGVEFKLGNGVRVYSGTGSPEGSKTANTGSMWLRSDGGALTSLYIKESGTGNTGWVAK